MSKIIRIVLLPLLLVAVLGLFSFYGCAGGTTTQTGAAPAPGATSGGELSQQQLQQILSDSLANYDKLNTYRFDMDMDIATDTTGGTQSGKMTMNTKSTGATVVAANQMQMNTEASIGIEGIAGQSGSQSMSYEVYQMPDWIYMKVSAEAASEQWMKMPNTAQAEQSLNTDAIAQQLGPLESAVKIEYLGSESVDGQDCYVLGITPDMQALAQWLAQQNASSGTDWQDLVNYADVFKEFSYVCYVAKETSYLKRLIVNMVMDYTAAQAGVSAEDFNKMTMNLGVDMKLYDHNAAITITLPDEAAGATEVSEDMFSD